MGLRAVKGSMGLRGWVDRDWVKHQVVQLGEFVLDTDLPRGRYLLLPFGRADTGPNEATHWVCPCGSFKVAVAVPGTRDRLVFCLWTASVLSFNESENTTQFCCTAC